VDKAPACKRTGQREFGAMTLQVGLTDRISAADVESHRRYAHSGRCLNGREMGERVASSIVNGDLKL
jgi:hypothetical protein